MPWTQEQNGSWTANCTSRLCVWHSFNVSYFKARDNNKTNSFNICLEPLGRDVTPEHSISHSKMNTQKIGHFFLLLYLVLATIWLTYKKFTWSHNDWNQSFCRDTSVVSSFLWLQEIMRIIYKFNNFMVKIEVNKNFLE